MIKLLIGRESGTEKPRLSITWDGQTEYFGKPGSVPKSVSRKHCCVEIGDDQSINIEDVTDNNFMFINGTDCKRRKNVQVDDKIELGPDRYVLDLSSIVKNLAAQQTWHIAHLEKIYNDYHQAKLDSQVKQGKLGALSALPGVLSMASIGLAASLPEARIVMIVIAAVFAGAFAVLRIRNASQVPLKLKQMDEKFKDEYVCPNPTCSRFLGSMSYKDLLKYKACPYCKAKYIE